MVQIEIEIICLFFRLESGNFSLINFHRTFHHTTSLRHLFIHDPNIQNRITNSDLLSAYHDINSKAYFNSLIHSLIQLLNFFYIPLTIWQNNSILIKCLCHAVCACARHNWHIKRLLFIKSNRVLWLEQAHLMLCGRATCTPAE